METAQQERPRTRDIRAGLDLPGLVTFPEVRTARSDFRMAQAQAEEQARRERMQAQANRPKINTAFGLFAGLPSREQGALITLAASIGAPFLSKARSAGLDFWNSLFGNNSPEEQETAADEVMALMTTGETGSEGLRQLVAEADPELFDVLVAKIAQEKNPEFFQRMIELGRIQVDEDMLRFLAPDMNPRAIRTAIVSNIPIPVARQIIYEDADPSLASGQTGSFGDIGREMREDVQTARGMNLWGLPYFTTQLDAEASTDPTFNQKSQIYAKVSQETDEDRREELINVINTANNFNGLREIEEMEDAFLANLQERRIQVNERKVPSYSQATNRYGGLFVPQKYSPYVQQ